VPIRSYLRRRYAPKDRSTIEVVSAAGLRWWSKALGITDQHLLEAVMAVGDNAEEVRRYLRRRR
jgi:Protein of unknown function (DUF3606)